MLKSNARKAQTIKHNRRIDSKLNVQNLLIHVILFLCRINMFKKVVYVTQLFAAKQKMLQQKKTSKNNFNAVSLVFQVNYNIIKSTRKHSDMQ